MTFRTRLTLVATAAVAMAVVLASGGMYVFIRGELRGQVDQGLLNRMESISYAEGIAGLRAFTRLYAELGTLTGTGTSIRVDAACVPSEGITTS